MATFRDDAIAAYQQRLADEAAAEEAARQAFVTAAKEALRPCVTDATGKLVLDPVGKTDAVDVDQAAGLVMLLTNDGSQVLFAVYPAKPVVHLARAVDGEWVRGPVVEDLDDVGEVLATGGGW